LASNTIIANEVGLGLNSNPICNSTSASGLESGYNDLDKPSSTNFFSLPGSFTSGIRSIVTGSNETQNCTSVFGVQDFVGNVSEWTRDRMTCSSMSTCSAPDEIGGAPTAVLGASSDYLSSDLADPFGSWQVDGDHVSCADSAFPGADGVCDNIFTPTQWIIENATNSMTRMSIPMGLPLRTDVATTYATSDVDFFQIGTDIFASSLRGDTADLNQLQVFAEQTSCGAMASGGHFKSNGGAGQWTMDFRPCTNTSYGASTLNEITFKVDQDPSYINRQIQYIESTGPVNIVENGLIVEIYVDSEVIITPATSTASDIVTAFNAYFAGLGNEMSAVVSGTGTSVPVGFSPAFGINNFSEEANPARPEVGFRCKIDINPADYDE